MQTVFSKAPRKHILNILLNKFVIQQHMLMYNLSSKLLNGWFLKQSPQIHCSSIVIIIKEVLAIYLLFLITTLEP